jgi:hypothetical protein
MDAQTIAVVIAGAGALGVVVWLLAKLGKAPTSRPRPRSEGMTGQRWLRV